MASTSNAGALLARWLMAGMLLVIGGWRIWLALRGVPTSLPTLGFSAAQLILGVLIAAAWQLRFTALAAAALVTLDAVLSHPFWQSGGRALMVQLQAFMQHAAIVGGFLLLALTGPRGR